MHPALLPSFPGAHAVEDALAAGVTETGRDRAPRRRGRRHGPASAPGGGARRPGDTPETLHERIKAVEHRLLPEVVQELIAA